MGQSAAEKTRGSPERYEAIETAPGPPKGAWRSPNRSSRNQNWGVAPIRSRAKKQVGERTRTRRRRSSRRRRRGRRGREGRRSWREVRRRQVGRRLGGGRVIGEEGTESTLRGAIGGGVEVEGRRVGGCGRGWGGRHAPHRIHLAVLPHTISLPCRLSIRKGRSMEGLGSTTGCTHWRGIHVCVERLRGA